MNALRDAIPRFGLWRRAAARRACVLLGVSLAVWGGPATAAVSSSQLYFTTSGQSLWESGTAGGFNASEFFGPSWNKGTYFDFGIGDLWGGTHGRLGFDFAVGGSAGALDVRYPMQVDLTFPDSNTLYSGSTFTIGSSFNALPSGFEATQYRVNPITHLPYVAGTFDTGAPLLQTSGPDFEAKLDAVAEIAAYVGGHVTHLGDFGPIGFDLGKSINLFGLDSTGATAFGGSFGFGQNLPIVPNVLTATFQDPGLDSSSAARPDGLTGNVLASDARGTMGGINLNFTNLLMMLMGFPPLSGSIGPFEYNLFSVGVGLFIDLAQQFVFTPAPTVHLDFSSPVQVWDGSSFGPSTTGVDFGAGDSVTLRAIKAFDLGVIPTVRLGNEASNDTDAILGGEFGFSALAAWVEAFGDRYGFGPLIKARIPADFASFDAYDNTFEVDMGASIRGTPINIGFKNRLDEVPLGSNLLDDCAFRNPKPLHCLGIDLGDLASLDPCIYDSNAPECSRDNFRLRIPIQCEMSFELSGIVCSEEEGPPRIYLTNADCTSADPLDCALKQLVGSTSQALYTDAGLVYANSGFSPLGSEIGQSARSTGTQGLQLVTSLGYDGATFDMVIPDHIAPAPEPRSVLLVVAGLLALAMARGTVPHRRT